MLLGFLCATSCSFMVTFVKNVKKSSPPLGVIWTSGNTWRYFWLSQRGEVTANGAQRVEARDAAAHPAIHRAAPTTEVPNLKQQSAESEKPSPKGVLSKNK